MIPEQPFPYYIIAKDYAVLNNEDKFIEYLRIAISKGYSNKNQLLNTKEFENYKNSKSFNLLLKEML